MAKLKKRQTTRSTSNIFNKLQGLRWQAQLLVFALLFASVSGGYLIYRSYASDTIPKGSDELILSYEIGMPHAMPQDDFTSIMNPSALLYGNGLLLCSDSHHSSEGQIHTTDSNWQYQQLNRGQVQKLVSAVKNAGFDKAASHQNGADGILAPASSGRFIRLNTTEGVDRAAYYPGDGDAAFLKVEEVLKAKCAEATSPYLPEDIYIETLILSDPTLAADAEELPAGLEIDPEPKAIKRKELLGNEAKAMREKIGKESKIFKKDGQAVKVRAITKIPDYLEPEPRTQSSKGKVSAAAQQKTRWLIVLGVHQDRPGWATMDMIQNTATGIRGWYNREVGETYTIDSTQYQVVRGSKTRDQYRNCPSWAGNRCSGQAEAIYYNLLREFQKPGYSTNIITAFEPTAANSALGIGSLAAKFANDPYTVSYGTVGVSFAGEGNNTPMQTRRTAAHELGHNFGLVHRPCDTTLMAAGCSRPAWPDVKLYSGQASNLRRYSTFFP